MPIFLGRSQKYLGSMLRAGKCAFCFPKSKRVALGKPSGASERSVPKQLDRARRAQPS